MKKLRTRFWNCMVTLARKCEDKDIPIRTTVMIVKAFFYLFKGIETIIHIIELIIPYLKIWFRK